MSLIIIIIIRRLIRRRNMSINSLQGRRFYYKGASVFTVYVVVLALGMKTSIEPVQNPAPTIPKGFLESCFGLGLTCCEHRTLRGPALTERTTRHSPWFENFSALRQWWSSAVLTVVNILGELAASGWHHLFITKKVEIKLQRPDFVVRVWRNDLYFWGTTSGAAAAAATATYTTSTITATVNR